MLFKELDSYARKVDKILVDGEQRKVKEFLSKNPETGALIRGSGGLRKLRWAASGRGKSGGARVIYYHIAKDGVIYLCEIYKKKDQENLTQKQTKNIKRELP